MKLVVTSPPYLDTTDYVEDQWLRLWFLGGPPYPERRKNPDDRHRQPGSYWKFLREAWHGLEPLLTHRATVVVRIGGARLDKEQLFGGLTHGLRDAFHAHRVKPEHEGVTTPILRGETTAFRRGGGRRKVEHDFVWQLAPRP